MKKFFFGIVAVFLIAVAGIWWFLPTLLQGCIETYIDRQVPIENRRVEIVLGSPWDVYHGRVERIVAEGNQVKTAELTYDHVKLDLSQVSFNARQLWLHRQFVVEHIGGGEVTATVAQEELARYLETHIDAIRDLEVTVHSDIVAVRGHLYLGDFSLGTIELQCIPLLKDNRLVVLPNGLKLNQWGVSGVNAALMKTIDVYDFRRFPIPVTAQKVELRNGKIVISAVPGQRG